MESKVIDVTNYKRTTFKTFNDFRSYVNNHPSINHPLFLYLKDCAKQGFTAKQYQIYRDNYFFRTLHTIPSIATLVIAAALNADNETLAIAGQNLYEETGSGNSSKVHSKLLELSHNIHAKTVFNLDSIDLVNVQSQESILEEAKLFVEGERSLYNSHFYCITLGANFAHETAAVAMLTNFYESFFLSYKNYYTDEEFNNLSEYFQIHLMGLEQQHASNAEDTVKRFCTNQENLHYLAEGSLGFLDNQSRLWDGLYGELSKAQYEGKRIPLVPENF